MNINKIPFGRTGHHSSRVIFGAVAVGFVDQPRADEVLDLLLKYGINHIDTAATYGDSELRVGAWMRHHRSEFFLATKTGERRREAAYDEIQRSLNRLQTDTIDLLQFHNLVDPDEWEIALGPGGALEAAVDAQKKGYVRFIGVTGHGNTVAERHLLSLQRYPFDSVLLPYNYEFIHQKEGYPADFEVLEAHCLEHQVAIQTIKSIARGRWGDQARTRTTWYEPLEKKTEIDAAVAFVLQRPGLFLNSSGDPDLLPLILDAAGRFLAGQAIENPEKTLAAAHLAPLFTHSDAI